MGAHQYLEVLERSVYRPPVGHVCAGTPLNAGSKSDRLYLFRRIRERHRRLLLRSQTISASLAKPRRRRVSVEVGLCALTANVPAPRTIAGERWMTAASLGIRRVQRMRTGRGGARRGVAGLHSLHPALRCGPSRADDTAVESPRHGTMPHAGRTRQQIRPRLGYARRIRSSKV